MNKVFHKIAGFIAPWVAVLVFLQFSWGADAWWLRARFRPSDTQYESVNVKDINPKWSRFTVLTPELLSAEAKGDLPKMKEYGLAFSREGDFNHDGIPDKAIVGVYADKTGKEGRFFLVLTWGANQRWEKAFLHEDEGEAGFTMIFGVLGQPDKIGWSTCMECEGGMLLRWTGSCYVAEAIQEDTDSQ